MADIIFDQGIVAAFANADLTANVEAILVMTNASLSRTAANVGALTLDEFDGANYARKDVYLHRSFASNKQKFVSKNSDGSALVGTLTWADLGAGTRNIKGVLFATKSGHATHASKPIYFAEFASAVTANGSDVEVTIPSSELFYGDDATA